MRYGLDKHVFDSYEGEGKSIYTHTVQGAFPIS